MNVSLKTQVIKLLCLSHTGTKGDGFSLFSKVQRQQKEANNHT